MAWDDEKERIGTALPKELVTQLKYLAVEKRSRLNKLFEEAIQDLLKKYGKNPPKSKKQS
jgi:metal-responsive CopG/Arc/MetJ family transcriptional regulator